MKYLKVWTSFRGVMKYLNDAEKGRLFDMMLIYAESFVEPADFIGNERFTWPAAKQLIDLTFSENMKQRENGKKGGRPKTQQNPNKPTETQINPNEPNKTLKEKESKEKESKEKENNEKKSHSEIYRRFTPPTIQEVMDYCKERGNNVDPERFVDFYSSKGWKVGNQPMKDWKAAVRTWEKSEKKPVQLLPAQDYRQRDYSGEDDEAFDRMLRRFGEKVNGA